MPQSYKSHTRWNIPFHFIASPILAANLVVRVGDLTRAPSGATAWGAVVAFGIWLGVALGRSQAITVQDRLIRLEETLRLQRLLPPEEHAGISALDKRHSHRAPLRVGCRTSRALPSRAQRRVCQAAGYQGGHHDVAPRHPARLNPRPPSPVSRPVR